jgi:type II secretory ATPase GspE/PulE/Tfp pilus assembly ATPase PilB-like protein
MQILRKGLHPHRAGNNGCRFNSRRSIQNHFKIGAGCVHCDNTGYSGREGIFELLTINPEIRSIIYEGGNQDLIRQAAIDNGMRTLHDAALTKMKNGITTIREVIKMTVIE